MGRAQVEAAGGVLWRGDPDNPEVALVHRPRYGDWSLPKGKLEPAEHPLLAALREITEETGFTARPGRRLGSVRYQVADGTKRVRYWACEVTGGEFSPNREVDRLWWGNVTEAHRRLDPGHSGEVLRRFVRDTRRTRVLALVRHASAGSRSRWPGPDADRPLDARGKARAETIARILMAYDVARAGHADVLRCRATLEPFTDAAEVALTNLPPTTAESFGDAPEAATDAVLALSAGGRAGAWCGQREVLPDLLATLLTRLGDHRRRQGPAQLRKGGLLLLHLDEQDRLVSRERLPF